MSALRQKQTFEEWLMRPCEGRRFGPVINQQLGVGAGFFPDFWEFCA